MMSDNPRHPDPVINADFYEGVAAKRALAWVFDSVLNGFLVALILPFTAFLGLLFLPFLWLVVGFAYRVLTLTGGSATLGMRLLSIQFRTHEGRAFGFGDAAVHTTIYTVSMAFVFPQIISAGLMVLSPRGQSLGDMLLGSVAINRPARHF